MTNPKNKGLVYREFGDAPEPAGQSPTPALPPQQQNLRLQASRAGRKGKTVTVITGCQGSEETLQKLLKQLKTLCGSGGTLKDKVLELQGDHCQKLLPVLLEMGYKAKISGG